MATATKPKAGFIAGALKAVRGEGSAQDLQAQIGEINAGLAGAQAALAKLEGERSAHLQDWLAKNDDKAAATNGQAIIAAKDTIAALEQKREHAVAALHAATVEREAVELSQRWAAVRKLMAARAKEVATLQAMADAVAKQQQQVFDLSQQVWDALPEKPTSRPLLFGNDLFKRVNIYMFGKSDGKLGAGGISPAIARKQPDLVKIDAEVQKILLLPLQKSLS